jgi:hypothetical protein|tara:strand:- start:19 stop:615 length:597 start_codon:yes stop_codon:yes gene_type:complete
VPVFYNPKNNKKFFYIHIPRTGGRFLVKNFIANGCIIIHPVTNKIISNLSNVREKIEGTEMIHAHQTIYEKWSSVKDVPHFTVVRDPINRFISASSRFEKNLNENKMQEWNFFNTELNKIRYDNWFKPQHEFISSKTKVWKYENGFNKNFCEWISDILSFSFIIHTVFYDPITEKRTKFKKTTPLINNIKKYYKKDWI